MSSTDAQRNSFGWEVRVPASTSNLGPGFDFLGLALSLWLRVRIVGASTSGAHTLASASGTAADFPSGGDNLIFRAFDRLHAQIGLDAPRLRFEVESQIPIARGLGSSGAAVAAGLLLARALVGERASRVDLLALGLELEGHPDNSSAALVGGCTLAVPEPGGGLRVVRQALHADLGFALAWPASGTSTHEARRALPREVPFADAVENPRRLALLLEGLRTADRALLTLGVEDRLHVPYRLPRIAGGREALEAARRSAAWLATISGSGSALIAVARKGEMDAIAAAMARAIDEAGGGPATARVVEPVHGAPILTREGVTREGATRQDGRA